MVGAFRWWVRLDGGCVFLGIVVAVCRRPLLRVGQPGGVEADVLRGRARLAEARARLGEARGRLGAARARLGEGIILY